MLLILGTVLAGVAAAVPLTSTALFSTDTWWHLATGKWIWENKAIPRNDPFSWSLPGADWTAHEWLFELLLYPFSGTTYGVIIFCAVPVIANIFLFWKLVKRTKPLMTGLILAVSATMLYPGLTARPQLYDYLFFTLMIYLYKENKWLYTIPVVILVWANMHSAVLLGVGLTIFFLVLSLIPSFRVGLIVHEPIGDRNTYFKIAVISILASLCTPWGYNLYGYVWHTISDDIFAKYITEWMSPPLGIPLIKYTTIAVATLVLGGISIYSRSVNLYTVLLCGGLFYLTLSGFRYYTLLGIALTTLLGEIWASDRQNNRGLAAIGVTLGILIGTLVGGIPKDYEQVAMRENYPVAAVNHLGQRTLNPYDWGGYLIFQGQKVFIDGRADIYRFEGDVFQDSMEVLSKLDIQKMIDKYHPDSILCRKESLMTKYLALLPGWVKTYEDNVAVVYKAR